MFVSYSPARVVALWGYWAIESMLRDIRERLNQLVQRRSLK